MLKTCPAILGATFALAVACIAGPARAGDKIAATPAHIQAQTRWVKAERDKSNAWIAEGFVPANTPEVTSGGAAAAPHFTGTVSGKPE